MGEAPRLLSALCLRPHQDPALARGGRPSEPRSHPVRTWRCLTQRSGRTGSGGEVGGPPEPASPRAVCEDAAAAAARSRPSATSPTCR